MTTNLDGDPAGFQSRLETLFDSPAPGLVSQDMEARVLARMMRRRRLRGVVLALGGATGVLISTLSLGTARLPVLEIPDLVDLSSGNLILDPLYSGLGSGGVTSLATAGLLTLFALWVARLLEEVWDHVGL